MKKVIISVFTLAMVFGLSQTAFAKEHHGPSKSSANKSSSYKHSAKKDRAPNRYRSSQTRKQDKHTSRARVHNAPSKGDKHYRHNNYDRHDRHYDRRQVHRHSDRYRHDRNDRRYRSYHKPRRHNHYYSYNNYPRYDYYPSSVYYLGQDWFYYGNAYHPHPRGHIHNRHCRHRYWEPLAIGVILGSVLGW